MRCTLIWQGPKKQPAESQPGCGGQQLPPCAQLFHLTHRADSPLSHVPPTAPGIVSYRPSLVPQALKEHLAQVSSTDKTLVEVAGGYHELQHGPEKAQVLKGIADWVLQHAAAAPAVAAASAAATGDKDAAAVASADVQVAA